MSNISQGEPKVATCGHLRISTTNNIVVAGQTLQGEVQLVLTEPCFPASNVLIGIYGYEKTRFRRLISVSVGRTRRLINKWFYGHHEIIRHSEICHEFLDGSPQEA